MTVTGNSKITIINCDKVSTEAISKAMGEEGYSVTTPSAGEDPVEFVTREKPDVLIIDLEANGGKGQAVFESLKAHGISTPILVISSPELMTDDLSKSGIAGVIVKPISLERLTTHIKAILEVQKTEEQPKEKTKPSVEAAEKPVVLIVDDEPDMQVLLGDLLSFSGFEVITAGDGMEGLTQAQQKTPDAILLDIMLPKLDGFQMCRLLKFNEKYRGIPIIMLTARDHPKDRELAQSSGADDYIVKPFETKHLIEQLRRAIDKKRKSKKI